MKLAVAACALILAAAPSMAAVERDITAVGFICGAENPGPVTADAAAMLPGVGNGTYPADTANKEAQAWHQEGLNLYHAFNHNEARAAFAKAAELDPKCAMCEWGVALGLGATLNYGITPAQRADALAHAERAKALVKPGDAKTGALVDALLLRYAKDGSDADRDARFAKAMDELARRYPTDDGIANLAAEALMIPGRGADTAGVTRAEDLIKTVLARHPDDTAAIHYYIHSSEFLGHPAEALPYAQRLSGLAPGASHLVHMAAHTMMHVGDYEDVALVDAKALKVDADVQKKLGYAGPLSSQMYYLHNYTFGLAGAMMAGDAPAAVKYADHASVAFPATFDKWTVLVPSGLTRNQTPVDRRITASARGLAALGRYAPDRALALQERPDDLRIQKIYRHYARGEAFAAKGKPDAVRLEATFITALAAESKKANEFGNVDVAEIAADVLSGRAALLEGKPDQAAVSFKSAAEHQERVYPFAKNFDPPTWWYPVRRSLAAAQLKAGRYDDAAREANASLKDWPKDALALRVLAEAEAKQGKVDASKVHLVAARKAWRGDLSKTSIDLT